MKSTSLKRDLKDKSRLQLVELPRVQLRFVPGPDPINGKGFRLFSKEFGGAEGPNEVKRPFSALPEADQG